MRHAVIMAGGSGTRLWPLSRRQRPKQLLRIFDGQSLLRRAFERLRTVLPAEQIYLITAPDYVEPMAAELPELPRDNLFAEPCPRDTANAVGLAAFLLANRDPDGTMGIFTADQIIEPTEIFADVLRRGFDAAERHTDAIVTFAVTPTSPHTGYGYVQRGQQLERGVYEVRQFKEKPTLEVAQRYVASGEYYWNSGMFVWRLATIVEQFRQHQPDMAAVLAQVATDFGKAGQEAEQLRRFESLQKISVDFAILEKAERVIAVELACRWLDVGSWPSLLEIIASDAAGNCVAAPNVRLLASQNNIVVSESDHLIATIGVQDLVIVHAADATLICRRDDAQRIKEIVEQLKAECGKQYT